MPIAKYHGQLTIPVYVADCSFFRAKQYDGVVFNIVAKTGFGRTVCYALAIIPRENATHISWVMQMCWRHGMELHTTSLFTDQGPLVAAAAALHA